MAVKVILMNGEGMVREAIHHLLVQKCDVVVIEKEASHEEPTAAFHSDESAADGVVVVTIGGEWGGNSCACLDQPELKQIVLCEGGQHHNVARLLDQGVQGIVSLNRPFRDLCDAIGVVLTGGMFISPDLAGHAIKKMLDAAPDDGEDQRLTKTERRVVQLVAEGKTSKEIAALQHVSPRTIEATRNRIMKKLNIRSVAALTKYAMSEGICCLEQIEN